MTGLVKTLTTAVDRLTDADLPDVRALLATEPISGAVIASRLHRPPDRTTGPTAVRRTGSGIDRSGVELWGDRRGGRLSSLCMSGGNLVPYTTDGPAIRGYAERALAQGRVCTSIIGSAGDVIDLWAQLRPSWGPARSMRPCQPLLATSTTPVPRPDPRVRLARPHELSKVLPASVAMYREEVGVCPLENDGGARFARRLAGLIANGLFYVRFDGDEVVFKAELGMVTGDCCQLQGVWVHPAYRADGVGTGGVAAVVSDALNRVAPTVSLYVNDFNRAARSLYARCGFTRVGTFASVLF